MAANVEIVVRLDGQTPGLGTITSALGAIREAVGKTTRAGEFLNEMFGRLAALVSVGSLVELTRHELKAEEAMGKLSQVTGLSIETLAGLKEVSQEVGLPFEELGSSLGLFADKVFTAVRSGGDAARTFRELEIPLVDANGEFRGTSEILNDVTEKFKNGIPAWEKAGRATDLFGRSGRELIPILSEGAEGLEKLRQKGSGISPEAVAEATRFNRSIRELIDSVEIVFRRLASDVLPMLQQLADWLKEITHQSDAAGRSASGLSAVFKGLAIAAVITATAIEELGKMIGAGAGLWFENFLDGIATGSRILGAFSESLRGAGSAFIDLAKTAVVSDQAIGEALSGHFGKAAETIKAAVKAAAADVGAGSKAIVDAGTTAFAEFDALQQRQLARTKGVATETFTEIGLRWMQTYELIKKISGAQATPKTPTPQAGGAGASGSFSRPGQAVPLSEAAKSLIRDVDKAYTESTKGKLALLETERQELLKKATEEIFDQKKLAETRTQIEAVFARKRISILDEEKTARTEIAMSAIESEKQLIEKDQTITEQQRRQRIISLLHLENELLQENIRLQQSRATDQSASPDARLEAAKKLQDLQNKLAENQQRSGELSQKGTFSGEFGRVLADAQKRWDTWATQIANTLESVMGSAINSISDGITGLIMGTKRLGQALLEIGTTVLTELVRGMAKMAVEWTLQHTIMRAVSAVFHTTETTQQAAHTAAQVGIQAGGEAAKTAETGAGAIARGSIGVGETVAAAGETATQVAVHGAGEASKTGETLLGSIARGAVRVGETIFSVLQKGIEVAGFIAGEITMTAATIAMAPVRIAQTLAEAIPNLINAAFKAASSVADIPYVGPILAVAAMASVIEAGAKYVGGFEKGGRPTVGGVALVGEKGPEFFVADVPGTILTSDQTKEVLKSRSDTTTTSAKTTEGSRTLLTHVADTTRNLIHKFGTIAKATSTAASLLQVEGYAKSHEAESSVTGRDRSEFGSRLVAIQQIAQGVLPLLTPRESQDAKRDRDREPGRSAKGSIGDLGSRAIGAGVHRVAQSIAPLLASTSKSYEPRGKRDEKSRSDSTTTSAKTTEGSRTLLTHVADTTRNLIDKFGTIAKATSTAASESSVTGRDRSEFGSRLVAIQQIAQGVLPLLTPRESQDAKRDRDREPGRSAKGSIGDLGSRAIGAGVHRVAQSIAPLLASTSKSYEARGKRNETASPFGTWFREGHFTGLVSTARIASEAAIKTAAQIPHYAAGGRPAVGRLALGGENGRELFVPDSAIFASAGLAATGSSPAVLRGATLGTGGGPGTQPVARRRETRVVNKVDIAVIPDESKLPPWTNTIEAEGWVVNIARREAHRIGRA